MSTTTAPIFTSRAQVDRLHDEMQRRDLVFTDRELDNAMYYAIECVANEDGLPFRYDFEFGDAAWERMEPHVLEYLVVDYDVFAGV